MHGQPPGCHQGWSLRRPTGPPPPPSLSHHIPRPLWLYDATISFPNKDSIIPYWVAVVVPLTCMLLSFAAGEWQRQGQRLGWRRGLGAFLHLALDGVFAFVVTAELTQVGKVLVGRYRPDYLARCNPAAPADIQILWGQSAADNPACNPSVGAGELRDGHYSFPSGHTSTVFVFAVYSVVYGVWAFCYRCGGLGCVGGRPRG